VNQNSTLNSWLSYFFITDECAGILLCMQRRGSEPVPGCTGLTSNYDGRDFCYDPADVTLPPTGTLGRVGNNGDPEYLYPLKACQGDCDSSSDCLDGLECYQRSEGDTDPIPGCAGDLDGRTDYCYDPNADGSIPVPPPVPPPQTSPTPDQPTPSTTDEILERIGNDGDPSFLFPLPKCKGDCDSSSDCQPGLLCFQRGDSDPGPPGCNGTPSGSTDYCFDPLDFPLPPAGSLGRVGNNGQPESLYPLKACQGDCDSDRDCLDGLKCFQRNEGDTDSIPSCKGVPEGRVDYCYDPNGLPPPVSTSAPLPEPTNVPVSSPTERPISAPEPSPTDRPTRNVPVSSPTERPISAPEPTDSPVSGPTDRPTLTPVDPEPEPTDAPLDSGVLKTMGNDGDPASSFPLGRCESDCDDDTECQTGLVCYERSDESEIVPGCTIGEPDGASDYCVDPADIPPLLKDIGDNYDPFEAYPLGLCEGDCDGDSGAFGEAVCIF